MIVVKIELHSAVTNRITTLGTMIIHNVGGTAKRGNYEVCVGNKRDALDLRKVFNQPQRRGKVDDYPRAAYNVWRLVSRALRSAFPEER